ncbi:MAG: alpha/beta hydrolase [Acidobacteriota bacterium]
MWWKRKKQETDPPSEAATASSTGPATEDLEDIGAFTDVEADGGEGGSALRLARATVPALVLAGVAGMARHRFQHSQMFLPEKYPTGIWEPQTYGVPAEDVWFESSDGVQLHGWWIPFKRARGTVLYCHGNAGNITNRIGVYRFLRRLRLNVLTYDYRGYGRSDGAPSEKGLYLDAQAAHDFLTESVGESNERIVLFGHSLGGAVAIDLATQREAAGLVVQSSFTDLREMAKVRFRSLPMHLITRNHFRSLSKVPTIDIPKLFIHGTQDETIPFAVGQSLYEAAAEPKEWFPIEHAGHNDVYRFGGVRYLWKLVRFCRSCLSHAKKKVATEESVVG